MTQLPAFVDAEAVVRAWINSRTTTLVGQGKPLPLGCHLQLLRSPMSGAYAVLERIGGFDDDGEAPIDHARVSFQVRASTKQAAAAAATAVANELRTYLDGTPWPVVVDGATRYVRGVESITGPSFYPDGDEDRYIVDALILVTPGP